MIQTTILLIALICLVIYIFIFNSQVKKFAINVFSEFNDIRKELEEIKILIIGLGKESDVFKEVYNHNKKIDDKRYKDAISILNDKILHWMKTDYISLTTKLNGIHQPINEMYNQVVNFDIEKNIGDIKVDVARIENKVDKYLANNSSKNANDSKMYNVSNKPSKGKTKLKTATTFENGDNSEK